jgi:SET domain-containing protein
MAKNSVDVVSGFRVPYVLRASGIAGRGVFAIEDIPRGALIWEYVVGQSVLEHSEASLRTRLAGLSTTEATDLLEHVYVWEGAAIEIMDDAKVWNHAPTPNTGNHPDEAHGAGDGLSSYALRDIAAGEELTDDYALHDTLPWFEAICAEFGATSCTALGSAHR